MLAMHMGGHTPAWRQLIRRHIPMLGCKDRTAPLDDPPCLDGLPWHWHWRKKCASQFSQALPQRTRSHAAISWFLVCTCPRQLATPNSHPCGTGPSLMKRMSTPTRACHMSCPTEHPMRHRQPAHAPRPLPFGPPWGTWCAGSPAPSRGSAAPVETMCTDNTLWLYQCRTISTHILTLLNTNP